MRSGLPLNNYESSGRPKVVDLFSGAGGLTLGFRLAGFEPILAVEKEPDFADTYAENFGSHVIVDDIARIVDAGGITEKADVVIGGPPCQGFSNLTGNKVNDPRRAMWRFFMDVVESSDCKAFVVENVPNFITSYEGSCLMARARELGFHLTSDSYGILLASNFGVPQNRRRAFVIGSKYGVVALPKKVKAPVSVYDAFQKGLFPGDASIVGKQLYDDLYTQPATGPDLHIKRNPTAKSIERYKAIPPGGNRFDLQKARPDITPDCWLRKKTGGTDLLGRLEWDGPARCTIRTEFYKPEKGRYLHPSEHRPITHWEAVRLQSFPDWFKWRGTKVRIAIQIGNAVPPLLAKEIAKVVYRHLSDFQEQALTDVGASDVCPC